MTARKTRAVTSHLDMIDTYVTEARERPADAQARLTWIKQAVEAIRRELDRKD